jgi:glycosyltransferase involved in cell wall biosynthesis
MYPNYHMAGSETTMHALLSGLVKRGHEARIIAAESPENYYEVDGVQVYCPSPTEANRSKWYHDLYNWSDVALTHLNCTGHAMHCAKDTAKPLVHLVHNSDQLRFHNVKASRAQLLIFNTEWLREAYAAKNFEPINPSIVLHPIIFREQYQVERDGAEAVTFINLTVTKGALVFYELAKRFPDVPFYGVRGAYGDQHEPPDLPNLKIFDQMPDLRPIWAKTRVVLMPSDYESYGRVAVEAACSGIPAIVAPTLGLKEALGSAGIFIDRNKIDDWETELRMLIDDERYYAERSKMALELASSLKPEHSLDRAEKALEIVLRHGLTKHEWTVEALGEQVYIKKALEGGFFNPHREPASYRPPLSKPVGGPPFKTDRRIWLDSNGIPVDQSSKDKQVLFLGASQTLSFDEALSVGIIDQHGVPFYSEYFEGKLSQEKLEEVRATVVSKEKVLARNSLPQITF